MIEIFDHEYSSMINAHQALHQVCSGFQFTEGPLWDSSNSRLLFSDIPGNTIFHYKNGHEAQIYQHPSNFSNGLVMDHNGLLVACEHQTRRVVQYKDGNSLILADSFMGKRLNSPNDLIIASDGSIIFTDPAYGLREGLGGPGIKDLDFQGVFRIQKSLREPQLLVDDFEGPNGLILTPDQRHLFINDTVRMHVRVFSVDEDWALSGGNVLIELSGEEEGKPDGMKLDPYGNIYCTGPGGIWIITQAGQPLGRIRTPERASNLAWGDDDLRSLYITAAGSLYKIPRLIRR